jgi:hypothetical protein
MSNESKCPGHNRAECVSCCWPAPSTGYTAVDMTTAAAQGFRDGAASIVIDMAGRDFNSPADLIQAITESGASLKK